MSGLAVVTMIVVCGVVWGGFVAFLIRGVRSERHKRNAGRQPADAGTA